MMQPSIFPQQIDPCYFDYGQWSTRLHMPGARTAMDGELISGRIYVVGGMAGTDQPSELRQEVWSYDTGTEQWDTSLAPLPEPRALFGDHTCALGNKLYVIGGTKTGGENASYSASVDVYDPVTDIWGSTADLPVSLGGPGVCTLNEQIYVCGGISQDHRPLRSLYRYDPETDTWHREQDMLTPRYRHTAVAAGGKLYVMGGISDTSAPAGIKLAEVYDPTKKVWSPISSLPTQLCEMASVLVDSDIYLFGGKVTLNAGILNTVIKYHVQTNSWRMVDELPGKLCLAAACAVGRCVYLFGGTSSWESGTNRLWAYDISKVTLERDIPDLLMDQDSLKIDLSSYFSHANGGRIEYAVCDLSDPTIVSTWMYDSLLIIKGIEKGEVQIRILAESGTYRAGDNFSITNLYTTNPGPFKQTVSFAAFPNPVSEYLHLEARNTGEYMVIIRAIDGRLILKKRISDPLLTLNITCLQAGVYLIHAWNRSFDTTEKLIKY